MKCPKCSAQMHEVSVDDVTVDRCSGCNGLWFDALEYEDLKARAKVIDIGETTVGVTTNAITTINCPVCPGSTMIHMVDAKQPHIHFESCSICYGRFYDAGEFADRAEFTLAERLKQALGLAV